MKDFFISYNKADRAWAEWIAWQLEEAGWTTVIQDWDFRPGDHFALKMQRAAEEATRTIAVLSPDYLTSLYTQPEWATAFGDDPTGEKGLLLPVRVRECKLKAILGKIVYIDLVGKEAEAAEAELISGVKRGRAKPSIEPGFPGNVQRSVIEQPLFPIPSPVVPTLAPWWGRKQIMLELLLFVALAVVVIPPLLPRTNVCAADERKDHFLADQIQWAPVEIGWRLEQGEVENGLQLKGRRITGDGVGLFRDPSEFRSFCVYRDFTLKFRLRLNNNQGAAWILRAQDFRNYYLFELVTSNGPNGPRGFNFYKYINGERRFLNNLPAGDYLDKNNFYFVTVVATGNRFIHTIDVFRDKSGPHCLGDFTDNSPGFFREGGVGFRPINGMDLLLQQFVMMTGAENLQCPLQE